MVTGWYCCGSCTSVVYMNMFNLTEHLGYALETCTLYRRPSCQTPLSAAHSPKDTSGELIDCIIVSLDICFQFRNNLGVRAPIDIRQPSGTIFVLECSTISQESIG